MSGFVWIRLPGDFSSCWAANILYRAEAHGFWIRLPGVFPQVGQLTYYIVWMRMDIGIRMPRVTTIIPYDWYVMYIITA